MVERKSEIERQKIEAGEMKTEPHIPDNTSGVNCPPRGRAANDDEASDVVDTYQDK